MADHTPKTFNGSLGNYQVIRTSDGSTTVFSSAFNEACHSGHGAEAETRYIYIDGCEIVERNTSCIFEVGFGIGTGWSETVKVHDNFIFYSTELDEELVLWSQDKFNHFDNLEKVDDHYIGHKKNAKAVILIGDARERINNFKFEKPFQAIYQDAFSPKRSPTLWTEEWFSHLLRLSDPEVILSTYSASSGVKKALYTAGWIIEERLGFASKRSSTRAFLKGEMSDQLISKLKNPKIQALRDE